MIRLRTGPRQARWVECRFGVRLRLRPLTTDVWVAAQLAAERQARELPDAAALIESCGGRIADLPDPRDRDRLLGLQRMLFLEALAVAAVADWEGVAGDLGAPLACTETAIRALIRGFPALAEDFSFHAGDGLSEVASEGEGCAPAPAGTGAGARDTADGAGATA